MTSKLDSLKSRDASAARAQDAINRLALVGEIRDAIRAQIERELGQYPQYAGHAQDWALGFITRRIRTKRGFAFLTGDVVLYREAVAIEQEIGCGSPTAYSVRNGMDTAVPVNAIEPLATSATYRHPMGLVTFAG